MLYIFWLLFPSAVCYFITVVCTNQFATCPEGYGYSVPTVPVPDLPTLGTMVDNS